MKVSRFGKGQTLEVVERKRKLEDHEIGKLLDIVCYTGCQLSYTQRVQLYNTFVREIKKNRLRRFIDLNYVLLVIGLLLACSCIVVLVTGYDGNLVLFYMTCIANLILCSVVLSKSFRKLEHWMLREKGIKDE